MPIARISSGRDDCDSPAPGREDVHVLRNQSTGALTERLWVHDADDDYWNRPAYTTARGNQPTVDFRPHKTTGEVAIHDIALPLNRPANFILEAARSMNYRRVAPSVVERTQRTR